METSFHQRYWLSSQFCFLNQRYADFISITSFSLSKSFVVVFINQQVLSKTKPQAEPSDIKDTLWTFLLGHKKLNQDPLGYKSPQTHTPTLHLVKTRHNRLLLVNDSREGPMCSFLKWKNPMFPGVKSSVRWH